MQKQEFIERVKIEVTDEQYQEIEAMYMAAGNMDKDVFCAEWKKHGQSLLVAELMKQIVVMKGVISANHNQILDFQKQKKEEASFLLERAQKFGDIYLLERAVKLVGHSEVIRMKFEKGLPLWDLDRKYIMEKLDEE